MCPDPCMRVLRHATSLHFILEFTCLSSRIQVVERVYLETTQHDGFIAMLSLIILELESTKLYWRTLLCFTGKDKLQTRDFQKRVWVRELSLVWWMNWVYIIAMFFWRRFPVKIYFPEYSIYSRVEWHLSSILDVHHNCLQNKENTVSKKLPVNLILHVCYTQQSTLLRNISTESPVLFL